jgi:glutamate synthase (NADPH/NADH) large chain
MLAVDLHRGELLDTARIDAINASRAPFKRWLKQGVKYLQTDLIDPRLAAEPMPHEELLTHQKMFNLTAEERDTVLKVLAETEAEAIGSMGDDTPLPLLSSRVRSLYDAFRQAFAQVTNPPIDSYRERLVMSLHTQIARESNLFELNPAYARQVMVNSPVLSQRKFLQILGMREEGVDSVIIDLNYPESEGLEAALERVCREAEEGVLDGRLLVVLSDRHVRPGHLPIHALMAVGAVHQHLVAKGLRTDCNMLVETATARDPHHFACLIGYGATAIYPYLAYQTIFDLARGMDPEARSAEHRELGRAYRRGIRVGLLKILSKMGISTIASYRGAALFEIVGLDEAIVKRCFSGTPSRVGGPCYAALEADQKQLAARAFNPALDLEAGGLFKYIHGGEYHSYNPDVVSALRIARGLDGLRQAGQRARAGHAARSAGAALGHLHADPTGRSRIRQQHGQGLRLGRHEHGRAVARSA